MPQADHPTGRAITVVGSSPENFSRAAEAAVREAAQTVKGIRGADVIDLGAEVDGVGVVRYRARVSLRL